MKSSKTNNRLKFSGLSLFLILICIVPLSACGKKGALYLPAETEPVVIANEPVKTKKSEKTETQTVIPDASTDLKKSTEKPAKQ